MLEAGQLTHQDIGQMDTYVRMFDEFKRGEDDNPTVGLILCTSKDETIVRFSILKDSEQLFASKYRLILPSTVRICNTLMLFGFIMLDFWRQAMKQID